MLENLLVNFSLVVKLLLLSGIVWLMNRSMLSAGIIFIAGLFLFGVLAV